LNFFLSQYCSYFISLNYTPFVKKTSFETSSYTDLFKLDDIPIEERFTAFVTRARAVYGLSQFEIVTSDIIKKQKPDPEGIKKLMKLLKVEPEEVIACGDHPVDMIAIRYISCD